MNRQSTTVRGLRYLSCIFMMLALLWLTVSLPFVYNSQQETEQTSSNSEENSDEDSSDPFANTTEEKTSGNGVNLSEEYLHDEHLAEQSFIIRSLGYKPGHEATYIAFHGELLSPPPEV